MTRKQNPTIVSFVRNSRPTVVTFARQPRPTVAVKTVQTIWGTQYEDQNLSNALVTICK